MIVCKRNRQRLIVTLATVLPALAAAQDSYPELQRNPFDRPADAVVKSSTGSTQARAAESDEPFLRAVLVAGSQSVVNFGGVMLQIGDSSNGYRLLAVREDSATFRKDGKRVVFSLYEPDEGDES